MSSRDNRRWRTAAMLSLGAATLTALGLGTVLAAPPAQAVPSATVWNPVPSPNTSAQQDNIINGMSCSSPVACVAVGDFDNGSVEQTLIEMWDGSQWSIASSPDTSPNLDNLLTAVSCVAPSTCVAVGAADEGMGFQTLVESWNGSSWSIVPSADTSPTAFNFLHGVTCTAATACIAVGARDGAAGSFANQTLVESWNGVAWSIVTSADTSTSDFELLRSVSCVQASACVAVGDSLSGSVDSPLIESWNGSSWSITPSVDTSPSRAAQLNAVSCTTGSSCFAVGTLVDQSSLEEGLIERWDGSSWTLVPNAEAPSNEILASVACTDASTCTAVGGAQVGTEFDSLVEQWDGSAWSEVPSPNRAPAQTVLEGVSCPAATSCRAGGSFNTPGGPTINQTFFVTESAVAYREVASDGGIFAFNAPFEGSMGGQHLNAPVVGIAVDPATGGYWEVASDGGIFAFNAPFGGSMGGQHLNAPVVGIG